MAYGTLGCSNTVTILDISKQHDQFIVGRGGYCTLNEAKILCGRAATQEALAICTACSEVASDRNGKKSESHGISSVVRKEEALMLFRGFGACRVETCAWVLAAWRPLVLSQGSQSASPSLLYI
jgi:hypothetical protein